MSAPRHATCPPPSTIRRPTPSIPSTPPPTQRASPRLNPDHACRNAVNHEKEDPAASGVRLGGLALLEHNAAMADPVAKLCNTGFIPR